LNYPHRRRIRALGAQHQESLPVRRNVIHREAVQPHLVLRSVKFHPRLSGRNDTLGWMGIAFHVRTVAVEQFMTIP
jgi:hypothetical protein